MTNLGPTCPHSQHPLQLGPGSVAGSGGGGCLPPAFTLGLQRTREKFDLLGYL